MEQPKKRTRIYIDNSKLLDLIKEFKKQKPPKVISEELGEMFKLLVDNVAYSRQFINYTDEWKNEMKSDALFNLCRYVDTFDPKKSKNPFAYFTQVVSNAFKMRIKKEKFSLHKNAVIQKELYTRAVDEFGLPKTSKKDFREETDLEDYIWSEEDCYDPLQDNNEYNLTEQADDVPVEENDEKKDEAEEEFF